MRAAAAELPQVNLAAGLRICLLINASEPEKLEGAAIRWLGRLCLEHKEIGFDDLAQGLAAFQALPMQPAPAIEALRALCARTGIDGRALG